MESVIRKQIITLVLNATIILANPVFAMDALQEASTTVVVKKMLDHRKDFTVNIKPNTKYEDLVTSLGNLFQKRPIKLIASWSECPGEVVTEKTWHTLKEVVFDDNAFTIWVSFRKDEIVSSKEPLN